MDYTSTIPNSSDDTDQMSDFSATKAHSLKADAIEKAKNFRNYAGEKAANMRHEAGAKLQQGKVKAKQLHHTAEDYVRENPTKSVLGAVGIGVIIGLILRR